MAFGVSLLLGPEAAAAQADTLPMRAADPDAGSGGRRGSLSDALANRTGLQTPEIAIEPGCAQGQGTGPRGHPSCLRRDNCKLCLKGGRSSIGMISIFFVMRYMVERKVSGGLRRQS